MPALKSIGFIAIFFNLFFSSFLSWGNNLSQSITDYFRQIHPTSGHKVSVEIKTPEQQWPTCEFPEIQPPMNNKTWGNLSMPVNCGQQRRFIQVYVNVVGSYLVSKRAINRNAVVTEKDFQVKTGSLDKLPNDIIRNRKAIQNSIATRNIPAGQFITRSMIRRPWAIKAGQSVIVTVSGHQFQVRYEGKAINNAASFDNIRVRLNSGQVITGEAQENGSVKMML
ncbi:flagellar basal body P-ring formation chaperone FlgA [Xenorhabdus szentirmaii]|uniref:Flagella basal body P-ring formation protein FlgA n=2 Tax=Xenorhabdus szentirmaii TaxID=290112 RepID=W1J3F9_9GAMM|nr:MULTISPECIES: flagellar basal body P-ring formation chaperone FlgA [Xenorhabdus]MBD2780429.1 flagellar basal body P-ring formation protein FlgA [Xenorhabdus sp. 38]MBD2799722.1 flagellar basal body P-ring formation protein FlgA [Xenorhabdus sp. M]MBD2821552.1 flagellar basal body P-ring formation protein FlgA [Xenorhabdus sp. 42]PHM31903.1 flagellar basal body P-ring biosynthesis protein FlgA [Xenorhabdus szentirmaii DSM 16338]PHM41703.1 flagellar basal body P-ring biosynthesis protein FlgA